MSEPTPDPWASLEAIGQARLAAESATPPETAGRCALCEEPEHVTADCPANLSTKTPAELADLWDAHWGGRR